LFTFAQYIYTTCEQSLEILVWGNISQSHR